MVFAFLHGTIFSYIKAAERPQLLPIIKINIFSFTFIIKKKKRPQLQTQLRHNHNHHLPPNPPIHTLKTKLNHAFYTPHRQHPPPLDIPTPRPRRPHRRRCPQRHHRQAWRHPRRHTRRSVGRRSESMERLRRGDGERKWIQLSSVGRQDHQGWLLGGRGHDSEAV